VAGKWVRRGGRSGRPEGCDHGWSLKRKQELQHDAAILANKQTARNRTVNQDAQDVLLEWAEGPEDHCKWMIDVALQARPQPALGD